MWVWWSQAWFWILRSSLEWLPLLSPTNKAAENQSITHGMGTGKGGRRFDFISLEKCVTSALKCAFVASINAQTHTCLARAVKWTSEGKKTHGTHNGALWPSYVRDGAISHHLLCIPASPLLSAVRDALQLPSKRLGCLANHFNHSFKCLSGWGWGGVYCTILQECCRWGMFGHDKQTFPLLFSPPPPTSS